MKIGHLDFVHNLERANKDLIGPNDKIFYGHVHCFILDLPSNYRNVCVEHTDYKPIDITSEFTPDEIKQLEEIDKQYLSSNIPDIDKAR
jgi:calcineurin-like phosphoesterase family protein